MNENIGGAGGFSIGLKTAFDLGYDWFLLMDDDGRNTLNMPIPTSQYGIGQIYNISYYGSFTLPAGGTWFLSCYQKTGDINDQITKIVSGGYSETYARRSYLGFAIRIK